MKKILSAICITIIAQLGIVKAQTDTTIVGTIKAGDHKMIYSKIVSNTQKITVNNTGLTNLQLCLQPAGAGACQSSQGMTVNKGQTASITAADLGGIVNGANLTITNLASQAAGGVNLGSFAVIVEKLTYLGPPIVCNGTQGQWVSDPFNKNIFICPKDTKVGIGTESPTSQLHIAASTGTIGGLQIDFPGGTLSNTGMEIKVYNDDVKAFAIINPNVTSANRNASGEIFSVKGNGDTFVGKSLSVGLSSGSEFALSVNGKIKAKEITLEATGWPDYVFEKDYKLKSIKELEAYIEINKHLPGVSPAKELETEGLSLSDMMKMQMEKIEEITLYIIEQNKKIEANRMEIEKLKRKK